MVASGHILLVTKSSENAADLMCCARYLGVGRSALPLASWRSDANRSVILNGCSATYVLTGFSEDTL